MSLLEIENLSLTIGGTPILKDIDLTIERGEVMGLVGESGSGKSMTALSVMRLLPAAARTAGRISFDGIDILSASEDRMCALRGDDIGMVFQEPMTALNPVKSIGAQVAEGIRWHTGATRADAEAQARKILDRVGLPAAKFPLSCYPHELSGGQRQRVVIAIACALKPKLLIADEPTTALDVVLQAQVLDLLRELVAEDRMALMLISHDLAVVTEMSDRITILRHGAVMEAGETARTLSAQVHPYTRQLAQASVHVPVRRQIDGSERPTAPPSVLPDISPTRGEIGSSYVDVIPTTAEIGQTKAAGSISPLVGEMSSRTEGGDVGRYSTDPHPPLLSVTNVSRHYPGRRASLFSRAAPVVAVDDVSFSMQPGQSVGLVGRSGCGKSTLARMVLALDRPTSGSIRLAGEEIADRSEAELKPIRRNMQIVFQDPYGSFDPRHRVERLVAEPLHLLETRPSTAERRDRVAHALQEVGLQPDDMDKYPHEFSGGQRQRISIARALITRPKLIVADEPVSALDVSIRAQVLDLFADLNRRLGVAYLFITHDLTVCRAITDDVMVMHEGRIVERGPTVDVLSRPQSEAAKALVAAAPDLHRAMARKMQEQG